MFHFKIVIYFVPFLLSELKTQFELVFATGDDCVDEGQITASANYCEFLTKQFQDLCLEIVSICLEIERHSGSVNPQGQEHAQMPRVAVQQEAISINQAAPAPEPSSRPNGPKEFVYLEDKTRYEQLQAEWKICEEKAATFTSNPNMKSARLRLQTAILSAVNEISHTSGQHLLEKLIIIKDALHGKPVQGNDIGSLIMLVPWSTASSNSQNDW